MRIIVDKKKNNMQKITSKNVYAYNMSILQNKIKSSTEISDIHNNTNKYTYVFFLIWFYS